MRKRPPKKFKAAKESVNTVQKAIFSTLKYRQIFDCPMTRFQIWNFLISSQQVDEKTFNAELEKLVKSKKVLFENGYYSFDKVDPQKIKKKTELAHKLMNKAKQVSDYLQKIPWVEMIGVTGSVAAFDPDSDSDIDMLIVTKPNRLWLTRLFVVTSLKILGVYWDKEKPAGTVCPNIMLTTQNLEWEKDKQNIYTANEILLLQPVCSKKDTYFKFLDQNSWAKKYLPNIQVPKVQDNLTQKKFLTSKMVDLIELAAKKLQVIYMKRKMTTEIVTNNFIHFNVNDSSTKILKTINQKL